MKRNLILAFAALMAVALLGLVIATPKLEPDPPLPVPNGHDDFLKAAGLIQRDPPDWTTLTGDAQQQALKGLVASNTAALDLVRIGFDRQSLMPPWTVNGTNSPHLDELASFKAIAQALMAASQLALIEGRTNEAAGLAIDCIRFGNESVRGGVLIDGLVGIAIKGIGLTSLRSAMEGVDSRTAHEALVALDAIERRTEPAAVVIERERQWARRGRFGEMGLFARIFQPALSGKSLALAQQQFVKSDTELRRMQLKLAVHAYQLEHGQPPGSIGDLVPQFLRSAPLDPATGQALQLD